MAEKKPNGESQKDERSRNGTDPNWEGFKEYVKKMAQVPKEALNEKLVQEKREKKEK